MGVVDAQLHDLSADERELLLRAFLECYRVSQWTPSGRLLGQRKEPLVGSTVRSAASALATAFRDSLQFSPLHDQSGTQFLPSIKALFRAMDNISPPEQRQKAITPKLLRRLWSLSSKRLQANAYDHAVDLIIGAFFFAMRPCEFVKTPRPGKTKIMRLRTIVFRDKDKRIISHTDKHLIQRTEFVTVFFEDQKNGKKMDARTQRRTGHRILCPAQRLARAVRRVVTTVPTFTKDTPLCSLFLGKHVSFINSKFTRDLLRYTCRIFGGQETFGFHHQEIGNRSIRSGAAMALFLNNHSSAKIMILGRWSSDAFLVYIRPQVLEWTNNMSIDMIHFDSFLDVAFYDIAAPSDPRTRQKQQQKQSLHGRSDVMMPRFHIHH